MANEEQIIQFVEHELTPEQERALMDECAVSDETRSLLKQHMSLSRNIAASLAAVAVPVTATDALESKLAALRGQPAPTATKIFRRTGILSVVAGITFLGLMTVAYFTSRTTTPAQQPPAIASTQTIVSSEPTPAAPAQPVPQVSTRHHAIHHHVSTAQPLAEKEPAASAAKVQSKKTKRVEQLTDKDKVNK